MNKALAMVVVAMSVAVAEGIAFAGQPGKESHDHQQITAPAVTRAEATNAGIISGPSQPPSVQIDMRNDNREH